MTRPPPGRTRDRSARHRQRVVRLRGRLINARRQGSNCLPFLRQAFCDTFTDPIDDPIDELRYSPGPKYSVEDETTVATVPAAGPLEFLTTTGLTQPGATALFRNYVITATGNERGSNTVTITRPPADDPGHRTWEYPRFPMPNR